MKLNKIKKITLDGFRAFPSKIDLNFEKDESVADIIVMYAVNGTGKTSAIEGVEWATTGKVSRIDNIIASNVGRHRNPKEGYILKNRQSTKNYATVSIELESGEYINRRTKPKLNRNNDYCSGVVESTIEGVEGFNNNILSQGTINRFSYEASNGGLFNSLISSKNSVDDIEIYDQLNSMKTRVESNNSEKKTEILLFDDLIESEVKMISELENEGVNNNSIFTSEEYDLFEMNFSMYRDISKMNVNDAINYITELVTSFDSLKNKLLDFDILSYRKHSYKAYLANKIISSEDEVIRKRININNILIELSDINKKQVKLDLFLDEKTLEDINNEISIYKEIEHEIEVHKYKLSRLSELNSHIYNISEKISINEIKNEESEIHHAKGIIESLFIGLNVDEIILKDEGDFIREIDEELSLISEKQSSLTRSSFLNDNPELSFVKDLRAKSLDFESITSKISELINEKEKIKSFEEKLVIIKSYVIDVVNDKELANCPSCGTKFDNMTALIESINTVSTDSNTLVDGVITSLTQTKGDIIVELDKLSRNIESLISEQKLVYSNEIQLLVERKQQAIKLYSSFTYLNIEHSSAKLTHVISQLDKMIFTLNKKISFNFRRKEKYGRWAIRINGILTNESSFLNEKNVKLKLLTENCLNKFGFSVDELMLKIYYGHVTKFEKNSLTILENSLNKDLKDNNYSMNLLSDTILKLRSNGGFSDDLDINKILESSQLSKRQIRANYNHITRNIKTYTVLQNAYFTEMVTSIQEKFSAYLQSIQFGKNISDKKIKIFEYKEKRELKNNELKNGIDNLYKINKSLDDAMIYFSDLASNCINNEILNEMFMYIEPHLKYDQITFKVELNGSNKGIYIQTRSEENDESTTPVYYLSEAQINILSICIFLADHARTLDDGINTIIIDDPVQSMDDLNSYALIDLCKLFARRFKKQIIITTHNRSFFNLFKDKLPESRYSTKYITL